MLLVLTPNKTGGFLSLTLILLCSEINLSLFNYVFIGFVSNNLFKLVNIFKEFITF